MGNGITTWDDVLSGSDEAGAEAPPAPSKPPKRGKGTGWDELLSQASTPAPVTLNARRGGFSGDMPPTASPESSGLSPLLSRIFPRLLKPSERTGSHYEAAPNQPTPDERMGAMLPEGSEAPLAAAKKYLVDPFQKAADVGAAVGREMGQDLIGGYETFRHPAPLPSPYGPMPPMQTDPIAQAEAEHPNVLGAARGVGSLVGGAVVDPRNWPFFGSGAARPILQRLISVGFTGLMGKGAVDAAQELHDNWDKLTPAQRAEIGTQSGLSAALAALTATHAVGSEASVSETAPRPERYQAPRQGDTGEPSTNAPPQPESHPVTPAEPYPTAEMPSGRDTSWEDVLRRPAQAAPAQSPQFPAPIREEPLISPHEVMGDQGELTGISHATIEGELAQPLKGWDEVLQQPAPAPESSTPGPGSPEYEALRKRVAALEPSGARAGSADALRKQADTLTAQIEAKRNPAISQQNPTARRARIAEGMSQDADYLEKVQRHILAVSDAAVEGTLPQSLTGVRSRAQIEDLLRHDKLPRMTFPKTYINDLLKATEHVPGTASARSMVSRARIRGEMPELYGSEELAAAEKLMQVAEKRGTSTKYMRESVAPYKRAIAAGLDSSEKWQQARQELKQLAGTEAPQRGPEQTIKAAERELIGQKIPGYFPTPKPLADRLVDTADIQPGMSVLEPSAGKGNIADSVRALVPGAKLDTVEQQTKLRDILAMKGHNVVGNDFLEHRGRYDRIVMNPPFEKGQDIEHVRHAYDLLKPGGRVVAIMSEGPFFRSDSKATAFRDWLDGLDGTSEKLPQGSFTGKESERQTGAASRLVTLDKPRAAEVTQAPRASVSTARQPVALRSQQETPGEYGGEAVVKTPTSDLPAKYKLVEAQDLTPSHNAETFAPNPSYPPGVQERAYHTSKEAQARVIQQAQNYDPRYTINTNPDAVNGPPIVTPDGTVLGGNSRTMSTQRLYERGQGDTYRDYLRKNAQQFGISADAVDKMEKPVLVREVSAPSDIEAARRLGTELNKNMTGALGTSERAVSAGRSITPQSLSAISGMLDDLGSDASIRDLLRERGRDVLTLLTRDGAITERERPQYVDTSTGGLSEEGKQFAERALLGTVVEDPTLMERTPKSILNKLDGSLADISSIAPRTDEYNLLPLIREAIAEHADIAARGLDVETHLAQSGMFGPERNPAVDAIVRKLAEKPKAVREAFRRFSQDANADKQGQGFLAMAEQPSATVAFNEAFGTKLTDSEFGQSVLQSFEREAQKGRGYEENAQQGAAFPPDASLREYAAEAAPGRATEGAGQGEPRVGIQQQPSALSSETGDPLDLFRPGPGAKTASAGNETGVSHLEQLRESLAHVTSPMLSITQRIEKALKQSVDFSRQRDSATKAWDRAKSVSVALWDAYRRPAPWTDFKDAIGKYSGALQRSNHELRLFSDEIQHTVPDKLRREALTNYIQADGDLGLLRERAAQSTGTLKRGYQTALRLNDSERTLANNVRNYFNAQLDEATKAGILENGVEDYVNQLWERNPNNPVARQVRAEIAYSRLQPNPTFAKHRVFESYFEGEQAGFNPKDKDIGFLLTTYQQSFSKAIGARAFIRSLLDAEASDGRPLVAITGRSNPIENTRGNTVHIIRPHIKPSEAFDYQTVNHPALRRWKWVGTDDVSGHTSLLEGDLAVHPEAYQHLKNILSSSALRQYALGRAALKVSSTLKQTLLSLSPFHQVQEGTHAALHAVNPVRIAAPRELDLKNPIQSQLIDHGLVVADFDGQATFQEGVASGGLISKVPVVGQIEAKYRDYLFKDYIPRLKMEMATEAAKRNFQRYKGELKSGKINRDQLFELTANQANAAFGELNYKMLGRNPTVQDLLRLTVLAPDFLEARLRFTGQAFKPYGREQAVALLLRGAVGMYVSARIANQLLDDDPHWDRPFSIVIKGREYALRTVPGDIYHLISDPRSFVYHRLNPTFTRPAVEALFGRDQLGRPRSAWEQVKDFVADVAPIPVQGSFDTGKSKLDALLQAGGVSSTKHRSAAERLARKYVMESGFGLSNKSEAERSLLRKYRRTIDDGTFNIREVANDVKARKLTIDDAHELELDSKQPALVRDFKSLTLDKALDVWDEMTPEEKKLAHDALETKAVNQLKAGKLLPEARRRMVVRVKQALRPEPATPGLGQPLIPMLRHLIGSQQVAP